MRATARLDRTACEVIVGAKLKADHASTTWVLAVSIRIAVSTPLWRSSRQTS